MNMIIFRVLHRFGNVKSKNYYKVLNLATDSSQNQIKKRYYQLAKFYHPDSGKFISDEKFKEITEAYNILKDPIKKRQYDLTLQQDNNPRSQSDFKPYPQNYNTNQYDNNNNYEAYHRYDSFDSQQDNLYRRRKQQMRRRNSMDINRIIWIGITVAAFGIIIESLLQIYLFRALNKRRSYPQKLDPQDDY